MKLPVFKIKLPEYTVASKPDHIAIGKKIDEVIKNNFIGHKIIIRCISSEEHRGRTTSDLIKIIKELGTDRYDSKRKGDRYDNIGGKKIDLFALDFRIGKKSKIMDKFIEPFYEYPLKEGRRPIRLDLVILYDRSQLKMVAHTYDGKRIKRDGFVFKNQGKKQDALIGFIQIL